MLDDAAQARVAAAVAAAEAGSDGEIVTVIARASDGYREVPLGGAILLALLGLALAALWPAPLLALAGWAEGGWSAPRPGAFAAVLLGWAALLLVVGRLLFALPALARALTPRGIAARRVRERARLLFRLSVESRTRARTGVLLYLSLAERRAEIVADRSIAERVPPETWGEAMAALLDGVRGGRPADGMVAAVGQVARVLAEHFPRSPDDTNELPDRLVLL